MSTTAVTNKSISLHPEEEKAVEQMDVDREISPAVALQHEDHEMEESHPQATIQPEEPRSAEPTREQDQTPDRDSKDTTTTTTTTATTITHRHENTQKQQQQQPAVRIEHSYRHGSVDETYRQADRPELSYQHVHSYRHESGDNRNRTQQPQHSYRYGPEQQVSYHYGRDQERTSSHQKERHPSPSPQQPREPYHQPQEQTHRHDYQDQHETSQDIQQDRVASVPVSSETSPVVKSESSSPAAPVAPDVPVTGPTSAPAAPVDDKEELPEASPKQEPGTDSLVESRHLNGSPEDRPRHVEQDTTMLIPDPRPQNKRPSVSDDHDHVGLVNPNTGADTSSSSSTIGAMGVSSGGDGVPSDDENSHGSKIPRKVREPIRKIPKVYPPRKPRVRPVAVEHLTMTIRTDSALSTLASAAVAIKDHQGPLSTLSVPPLSPTLHASSSSSGALLDGTLSSSSSITPKIAIPASSANRGGRASNKANIPQDAGGYRCELCPGERFGRVHDLKRHQISKHNEMTWPCDFCHRPFVRRDALLRHYAVKASRRDGVHPTTQEESRLQEAKARAKLLS
ncbi:hypothetical protein BGX23_008320 [Mortierella sp. AD031]|nr:hypothetical protein BGX23_008320 [Mortierella sp. AD031]KAG0207452.1 hypothetical protein BGX33_006819 [Mortierella sp. NVP41]